MMLGSKVWFNGTIIPIDQAHVGLSDRGFTLGDGLFETLLWTGTHIRFFDDHMARLSRSAVALGFEIPRTTGDIKAGLEALAQDAAGASAALRLTFTRGIGPRGLAIPDTGQPCLIATIAPLNVTKDGVSLQTVAIQRNAGAPSAQFKTLSYIDNIMALAQARALGGDDAIMLGTTGNIACASSANLIMRLNGKSLTPALTDGAMAGVVRGHLIKAGLVEEANISPEQLLTCDSAALSNALIGVRGVQSIDHRTLNFDAYWLEKLQAAL
jgi:branched-chain amino acid aminotransferase